MSCQLWKVVLSLVTYYASQSQQGARDKKTERRVKSVIHNVLSHNAPLVLFADRHGLVVRGRGGGWRLAVDGRHGDGGVASVVMQRWTGRVDVADDEDGHQADHNHPHQAADDDPDEGVGVDALGLRPFGRRAEQRSLANCRVERRVVR